VTLRRIPGERLHLAFRIVAAATLVAAFAQVTLGGVVRVTGSGLGCPDWPLCHGRIIPPFEFATLIEYSHRLSASALSVLMLSVVILAWVFYRSNRWVLIPSLLGLVLVVVAAALGGLTVLTELSWWVRLFHLGSAQAVVACMVIVLVAAWRTAEVFPHQSPVRGEANESARFNRLVITTIAGTFLLILSGSYIVGFGAGSSCATWPLCRGSLFPDGTAYAVHMGHRYIAALIGVLIIATAVSARLRSARQPEIGQAGIIVGVVFAAQLLLGAAIVWSGFTAQFKALHLSMATLVWMSLVLLATLVYIPHRLEITRGEGGLERMPELNGLTP
jgi:heme A synthase